MTEATTMPVQARGRTTGTMLGLAVMGAGFIGMIGYSANAMVAGSAVEKNLAAEFTQQDANLSAVEAKCMGAYVASAVHAGGLKRPGPVADLVAVKTAAIASAKVACAG